MPPVPCPAPDRGPRPVRSGRPQPPPLVSAPPPLSLPPPARPPGSPSLPLPPRVPLKASPLGRAATRARCRGGAPNPALAGVVDTAAEIRRRRRGGGGSFLPFTKDLLGTNPASRRWRGRCWAKCASGRTPTLWPRSHRQALSRCAPCGRVPICICVCGGTTGRSPHFSGPFPNGPGPARQ